jgi:hypothetical protein
VSTGGKLTLAPWTTAAGISVPLVVDGSDEPNEHFRVDLGPLVNTTPGDVQATLWILDDDPPAGEYVELSHGSDRMTAFGPSPGEGGHRYRLSQKPYASYELVVDATSGDIGGGAAAPLAVQRWTSDFQWLQTAEAVGGVEGIGYSRSLRWENGQGSAVNGQMLAVFTTSCLGSCDADDVYRVRLYETTYAIARFNQSGTQSTVVVLQNLSSRAVNGSMWFWSDAGQLLASQAFNVPARGLVSQALLSIPGLQGQSGSVTVTHDGGYGALAGKAASFEATTGYTFDTPMLPRSK